MGRPHVPDHGDDLGTTQRGGLHHAHAHRPVRTHHGDSLGGLEAGAETSGVGPHPLARLHVRDPAPQLSDGSHQVPANRDGNVSGGSHFPERRRVSTASTATASTLTSTCPAPGDGSRSSP